MRSQYLLWAFLLAEAPLCFSFSNMPLQRRSLAQIYMQPRSSSMTALATKGGMSPKGRREMEIRRKIIELKKEGRIKNKGDELEDELEDDDEEESITSEEITMEKLLQKRQKMRGSVTTDEYADKIKAKLGKTESESQPKDSGVSQTRRAQLGSLASNTETESDASGSAYKPPPPIGEERTNLIDPSLFENPDDDDEEPELAEEDLIELVAKKMEEKKKRQASEKKMKQARMATEAEQEELKKASGAGNKDDPITKALKYKKQKEEAELKKTTTGVGGAWTKNETALEEEYRPSRGSWGYFPRPKDISKAYGGGRKIVVDDKKIEQSAEATRDRLKAYREKVGIEVQAEKDHATEIEEALRIATYAMQRGVYSSAVSALEKVTKWCGSNSKVGGKVFLELAMAYEAVGRAEEAIAIYTTLSKCRIEEIKFNAKRLLYGIEAMNFMRNEVNNPNFSRKKIRNTFIDTTGLANIAENFDDRYQTAYIDLDSGFYRKLTESVVRSNREARQILLKATGSGEVQRMKIVQALRSLSRTYDTALEEEIKRAAPEPEPVAVMDGKPILKKREDDLSDLMDMDTFNLASAEQMIENLDGEWRLQLLADKKGDGVRYYNTTLSWQRFDTEDMRFESFGPKGFLTLSESGNFEFNGERRIVERGNVSSSGAGGMFSALLSGSSGGSNSRSSPQQIVLVDSVLLVTRGAPNSRKKSVTDDNVKDYFAVWRRVEPGTYSEKSARP